MTSITRMPPADALVYEQIANAVMETERGRWFMAEYARRNRQADTETLLGAIDRLTRMVASRPVAAGSEELHQHILEMARAILRTEKEIRALHARDSRGIQFAAASDTLDAVVETTEKATSTILSAAERMQEKAWILREQGIDAAICDELDRSATEIYTACSFQDLTAQRIAKAVATLQFLDKRIRSLVETAGLSAKIAEEIENIDAAIALEMERSSPEPDIWMSEAHQAEIDDTFDFFVPAEVSEPTMVGAEWLDLSDEKPATPPAPPEAMRAKTGPSPLESLEAKPVRERLESFR